MKRLLWFLVVGTFICSTQGYGRAKDGNCPVPKGNLECKPFLKKRICFQDMECPGKRKCCPDGCGNNVCTPAVLSPKPILGQCPEDPRVVLANKNNRNCRKKATQFCYKGNCKRCCHYRSRCNPNPKLLDDLQVCAQVLPRVFSLAMGKDDDRDREDRDGRERERKEKKEKKKRRSASSESAERSREREKRRRKQQQQVVNKNRKAGEGGVGGQSMFWDGFQWVPRADTGITNDINASRKNRRLYLGNLPYHLGVTEDSFSKQLYETMRDRSMCNDPNQNPVLHVWFARDKGANYGFCEIASQEETERALQLDGMLVLGVPVSIKRPNDAVSPLGMIGGVPVGMQMPGQGGMLALPSAQVSATSPIIRIDEILKVDEKTTEDDFNDVKEDMQEGCGAHGKLVMVAIVKPEHAKGNATLKPGDVYLQCATTDEATKVMRAMGHRKYDGRQISMTSYEESKFNTEIKPLF